MPTGASNDNLLLELLFSLYAACTFPPTGQKLPFGEFETGETEEVTPAMTPSQSELRSLFLLYLKRPVYRCDS